MVDKKEAWDKSYHEGKTPWRREQTDLSGWLEKAGVFSGSALDLGCGTGEVAKWLAQHSFWVEGIDFSEEAIKVATKSLSSNSIFVVWDLENLVEYPFKRQAYDLIIDSKTLAFIGNKEKYLSTVASKLNGVFILQTFLKHNEKPSLAVKQDDLEKIFERHFKTIRRDFYYNPTKENSTSILAEYFLVAKKAASFTPDAASAQLLDN